MKKVIAVLLLATSLAGCGIAAKVDARNDMMQSRQLYKSCLIQNPSNPAACAGLKAAYQADMQAYRATSAGIMRGRNDTVNVTTTNGD